MKGQAQVVTERQRALGKMTPIEFEALDVALKAV